MKEIQDLLPSILYIVIMKQEVFAMRFPFLLGHLRRISFLLLIISWIVRLPMICVLAYPIVILISFFYCHFVIKKGSVIESILMFDVSEPIHAHVGTREGARLWNIWHFRNYDCEHSIEDILIVIMIRLFIVIICFFMIISIARYYVAPELNVFSIVKYLLNK